MIAIVQRLKLSKTWTIKRGEVMTITCACGLRVEHLTALLTHWRTEHGDLALKPWKLPTDQVEIFKPGKGKL